MANRYYLVAVQGQRLTNVLAKLQRSTGVRERANQIGYPRLSIDGTQAIVQANTTDDEHSQVLALGVTVLGFCNEQTGAADPSVLQFLADHATAWESGP